MNNIYITASPFQLISAIEAKNMFKGDTDIFAIFLTDNALHNSFLQKIQKMFIHSEDVIWIDHTNKLKAVTAKMRLLKKIKSKRFDNVFIGHFAEYFMRLYICNLIFENLFLLDDGTATLVYNRNLTENVTRVICHTNRGIRGLIKKYFILKYRLVVEKHVRINWFTMFDFNANNGNIYIKHNFEYLKSRYINSDAPIEFNKVYFIGPGLVHDNIIKSNEIYVELVKKIRNQYPQHDFVYLPHRVENADDLKALTSGTDIQILQFDNVLEIAFIANNIIPSHICSFYSTALYSLKLLYPQCQVDFMLIDKKYVTENYVEVVSQVEDYYKNLFNSICKISE